MQFREQNTILFGCVVLLWHNEGVNVNPGLSFLCGAC